MGSTKSTRRKRGPWVTDFRREAAVVPRAANGLQGVTCGCVLRRHVGLRSGFDWGPLGLTSGSKNSTRGQNRRCGTGPGRDVAVILLAVDGRGTINCGCDLCRRVVAAGGCRAAAACDHFPRHVVATGGCSAAVGCGRVRGRLDATSGRSAAVGFAGVACRVVATGGCSAAVCSSAGLQESPPTSRRRKESSYTRRGRWRRRCRLPSPPSRRHHRDPQLRRPGLQEPAARHNPTRLGGCNRKQSRRSRRRAARRGGAVHPEQMASRDLRRGLASDVPE